MDEKLPEDKQMIKVCHDRRAACDWWVRHGRGRAWICYRCSSTTIGTAILHNVMWRPDAVKGEHYTNTVTGRFLSVAPKSYSERALHNTQAWNRYTYVLNNPIRYFDPNGRDAQDAAIRTALITYLMSGFLDPKLRFPVLTGGAIAKMAGVGVKGWNYTSFDLTDWFTKGNGTNSISMSYQQRGLGVDTTVSFNGIVPTLEEFYLMAGPFEKSVIKSQEDKFSTGAGAVVGFTVDQKLDELLPALIEYMGMSTPELIVEVEEKLEKEGYRFVNGQLVLVLQKK